MRKYEYWSFDADGEAADFFNDDEQAAIEDAMRIGGYVEETIYDFVDTAVVHDFRRELEEEEED